MQVSLSHAVCCQLQPQLTLERDKEHSRLLPNACVIGTASIQGSRTVMKTWEKSDHISRYSFAGGICGKPWRSGWQRSCQRYNTMCPGLQLNQRLSAQTFTRQVLTEHEGGICEEAGPKDSPPHVAPIRYNNGPGIFPSVAILDKHGFDWQRR